MKKNLLFKKNYAVELVRAIRGAQGAAQLRTLLSDYHEHDIAEALTHLTPTERGRVVAALDTHTLADIFAYLEDAAPYIGELPVALAAKVISCMDSDDALDVLESLSPEKKRPSRLCSTAARRRTLRACRLTRTMRSAAA